MKTLIWRPDRRLFLGRMGAVGAAFFATRGLFADELSRTPELTEGPYYPNKLPLDTDNDLLILNDNLTPAVGEITHLTGRVLQPDGSPVKDAAVEIWQCDANEVYIHSADSGTTQNSQDKNFQGFGRFLTGSTGGYYFRTIKPVPYPGRPSPHIHFKVKLRGREVLTSQIFIRGHSGNAVDGVFHSAGGLIDRELVQADFKPIAGSRLGELSANFDIVLGRTPSEAAMTGRSRS